MHKNTFKKYIKRCIKNTPLCIAPIRLLGSDRSAFLFLPFHQFFLGLPSLVIMAKIKIGHEDKLCNLNYLNKVSNIKYISHNQIQRPIFHTQFQNYTWLCRYLNVCSARQRLKNLFLISILNTVMQLQVLNQRILFLPSSLH